MAKPKPTPGVDPKKVEARIQGRKAAGSIIAQKMLSWPRGYGADYADALCDELRQQLPHREEAEPTPFARLAALELEFGTHSGKPLSAVPLEYLDWLATAQASLSKRIREYIEHPERPKHG